MSAPRSGVSVGSACSIRATTPEITEKRGPPPAGGGQGGGGFLGVWGGGAGGGPAGGGGGAPPTTGVPLRGTVTARGRYHEREAVATRDLRPLRPGHRVNWIPE